MAYIVPRVLIKQEFTQQPVFADQPLAALVIGPQFNLYRYSVDSEKPLTAATHASYGNKYQADADVVYGFPNQVLGTRIDKSFVKVFFEKAEIEYFPNVLASTAGDTSRVAIPNTTGKYYPNRFKTDSLVLKTANSVDRSADFADRDVAPGDVVDLTSATAGQTVSLKVKALHASKSVAVVGTATADTDNHATQVEDIDDVLVSDTDAGSTVTAANATSNFDGGWTAAGQFVGEETFVATVTTGGNLTAVRFSVESPAGLFATKTNQALTTAILDVYSEGTNDVSIEFTGSTTFTVGDTFEVTAKAAVTSTVVPTSGGTYTGTQDLVYKLTVVRGGPFYDPTANTGTGNADVCARVAVTSSNIDSSATVNVDDAVAFNVGSYGVTATFAAGPVEGGLIDGDVYYITATASKNAATNVIETYESLPATLVSDAVSDWEVSSLRLVKSYEVNQLIPGNDVDVNWEVDATAQTITINSGITTTDAGINDGADAIQLDVKKANVYIEHRDLVVDNAISIGSLNTTGAVETVLGTVHPDNPLAQGVYDAVLNSAGVTVYFVGVRTNDLEGYNTALDLAKKSELYYGIVPLTFDRTVQDAVVGHVHAQSTPEAAKWRKAWVSLPLVKDEIILDTDVDGNSYTATITDDPLSTGTDYTLVTVAGAQFVTDEIRPTDKVLINFRIDSNGDIVNDEYTVLEVRTETTLVLQAGPSAAFNVPVKVQIKRVFTKDEQIDALAVAAGDFNSRRVNSVFPSTAKNVNVDKDGYFLAAALAGLRSGAVPHQGLTNSEVLGFTDLADTVLYFTEDQLNRLAEQGIWIVTQDTVGATPYVRHQLTTDSSNLNASEDSVTTNVDSISFGLRRVLAPYIGKYNVNPDTVALVASAIDSELRFRQTGTFTARAGNQLIGFEITRVAQNPTFQDRIDVEIVLQVPYPMNFITVTLLV